MVRFFVSSESCLNVFNVHPFFVTHYENLTLYFCLQNMQLGIHRRMAIVRFKDESAVKKILALPAESHIIDGNVVQISKTADEHWNK